MYLNMLCYIPREHMYLDILHVFYTYMYPKGVQDVRLAERH